jgi:hypothetical protein
MDGGDGQGKGKGCAFVLPTFSPDPTAVSFDDHFAKG